MKNSLVFRYDVDKIDDGVMQGKEGEEGTRQQAISTLYPDIKSRSFSYCSYH